MLRGTEDVALAVVIVEVQLGEDDDKLRTWPLYVAAARARYRCPAMLLVLAPDPAVARWASQAIELGHPGFALRPVVIGYDRVPRLRNAETARATPELAVLSAMATGQPWAIASTTGIPKLSHSEGNTSAVASAYRARRAAPSR